MKKNKMSENTKLFLTTIALFVIVALGSVLYMKQIDRINNGELYVVCDCEMDK